LGQRISSPGFYETQPPTHLVSVFCEAGEEFRSAEL
jgi:hypothetical protein